MNSGDALRTTFGRRMAGRSLIVALLVGTAINQGPELYSGQPPVVWKLLLTYLVPFLVASFGSYSALRGQ